jgi:4-amino-4-deoxy-L-arabinose transferase-like glycosyltransferase
MAVTLGGRIGIEDGLRRRLTIFAFGFGAFSLLEFLLGVLDAFDRDALIAITLVAAVLAVPFLVRDAPVAARVWRRAGRERWLIVAAGVILLFDAFLASAPPTSGDAIAYHLTAPKLWLDAGKFFPIWWEQSAFQPLSVEMHFALAEALGDGRAAIVVGAGLGAFSAACVYGLARQLYGAVAAAVAALVWVAQGMFLWETTGGFVELALGGFLALAGMHLVALRRSGRLADAAFAGFAAGLACATKFHGSLFVPVVVFLAVVLAGGTRRHRAIAGGVALAVAAIALPWYLRNWIVTGNPVYPLASTFIGGKYIDAGTREDFRQSFAGYGVSGIWKLPFFPLEFVLHHNQYERGYSFSPALFVLPVVAVVLGRLRERLIGLGLLAYVVLWWTAMHQITRYLLIVLVFAAVLSGFAVVALWQRGTGPRLALGGLAALTIAPLVAISGLFAWQVAPGALGTESKAHFVQRLTGTYDAFKWMDRSLPARGRVLIGNRDTYWLDRPYSTFGNPYYGYHQFTNTTVERMRGDDVRYLAFFAGGLPPQLDAIKSQLKLVRRLRVQLVTSRTLGHKGEEQEFDVWKWCGARPSPCRGAAG